MAPFLRETMSLSWGLQPLICLISVETAESVVVSLDAKGRYTVCRISFVVFGHYANFIFVLFFKCAILTNKHNNYIKIMYLIVKWINIYCGLAVLTHMYWHLTNDKTCVGNWTIDKNKYITNNLCKEVAVYKGEWVLLPILDFQANIMKNAGLNAARGVVMVIAPVTVSPAGINNILPH